MSPHSVFMISDVFSLQTMVMELLHTLKAIHSRIFSHVHLPMKKHILLNFFFKLSKSTALATRQNLDALLTFFLLSLIHLHEIMAV